jgi:hypothetical protein
MTLDNFRATLSAAEPPSGLPAVLRALWHDARGEWNQAHSFAQDIETPDGAWVHAYLHRKEGDLSNARYWYHRARQPEATDALDAEWARLVTAFLKPDETPEAS